MSTNPAAQPYYLRGYKVTIEHLGETLTLTDSKWEPEALRAKFRSVFSADTQAWIGEVTIWNLSPSLEQSLLLGPGEPQVAASGNTPITQGDLLTISAGYQVNFDPEANIIFQGTVLQPAWDRENVTDFKTTLRAIIDPGNIYLSTTMGPFQTQGKIVAAMATAANTPIEQVDTSALPTGPLPRAKPVFGTVNNVLDTVQRTTDLRIWVSPKGLNVRAMSGEPQPADLVFGPSAAGTGYRPTAGSTASYTPTLIGTPQQTEQGILFRVLLDSRIKMASIVKIDQSVIRQLPRYPGNATFSQLDQDGSYVVCGMTHQGDTRGQEWYTDVTALTLNYWKNYTGPQNLTPLLIDQTSEEG